MSRSAPALSGLAHDEPLRAVVAVRVAAASGAAAGRGARHREDRGGRVRYLIEDQAVTVWLVYASPRHPKDTE